MDNSGCSGCEQESLARELTQGMELAIQLKAMMGPEVAGGMLAEKIYSSFEKALMTLKCGGSMEQSQQHVVPSPAMPGSPISVIGSPKSEDLSWGCNVQQDGRDFSKKRKTMPSWTDQVKASSEKAGEAPPDDGYSWRKYGQKDILGAKHPRSYYRCTYRNIQGCCAIKQVQRNDEDASLFDITYKGTHTCTLAPRSKSEPTSPEKQKSNKQYNHPTIQYQQPPNVLLNFQTGLSVDTQNLENQETEFPFPMGSGYENHTFVSTQPHDYNFYGSFPPSYTLSPATSASNYFSTSPSNMSTFGGVQHGQHSELDITEIISATTSGTNSPIIGIEFPLDQLDFNSNLPFDSQVFFPSFSQAKE